MSLVDVNCPNCGAAIQLDQNREEGFCSYCGSKVIVQEAIKKVKIGNSGNLFNYLQLAESAYNSNNEDECLTYANKALEIDPQNSCAWIWKMKAVDCMGTINNHLRLDEYRESGLKAIESANGDEAVIDDVYRHFLSKAKWALEICDKDIHNTDNVKRYYNSKLKLDSTNASEKTHDFDNDIITGINNIADKAVDLKNCVSVEFIKKYELCMKYVVDMANSYVSISEGINTRLNIYGYSLSDNAITARKDVLKLIKKDLPESLFANVDESKINNEKKDGGGCYIATAVYGSYDAPEVLVLRQFRDNILSATALGRLFIKIYYRLSPPIANRLKNAKHINGFVRSILDKWVNNLKEKY